jgi:hypothetical protein
MSAAPRPRLPLLTQSICPAGTATFIVAATGSGTLSYQWQKNSVNVTNGGHYAGCATTTLTVSSADSGDVAGYRCVVTNSSGSTNSNAANLTLKLATAITQHPQSQTILAGNSATFAVAAAGEGTLSYQWQKDVANITNGAHYAGSTTTTLTISSADSSDAANYRCVVTGGCGNATSNQATLTVSAAVVPADLDHDGDVDQDDFSLFDSCFSGPAVPLDPGCEDRDFDGDGHIDQEDFGIFQRCYSGEGNPADANCGN